MYLEINSFVMKAEKLKDIPEGQLGVSKFHRDGMSISKHDDLSIKVAKIQDQNPLNAIDLLIDLLYIDESLPKDNKGAYTIHEKDIF